MLERAPEEESGGNSRFTAGLFRLAYTGPDDLKTLIPDLTADEIANTDFGTYTEEQFLDDMARVTEYRCDPDLTEILVKQSLPTAQWMRKRGVRFTAAWGRQAFKIGGKFKFWGGLTVEAVGGGPGLIESETQIAKKAGIEIWYGARAIELIADDDGVHGVVVKHQGKTKKLSSRAVVLAAGGFQANTEWRTRYMGPGWELAKVRGTRFNTGDAIRMALDIGAAAHGNWSGCHAVAWDRNAPETGDLAVGDGFQKHSYPWGVYINAEGRRFVDEGADFRNYTYAKYGRVILHQPRQFAWQIFDAKVKQQLRDEYKIRQVTKITGNTLEELVAKMDDTDQKVGARDAEEIQQRGAHRDCVQSQCEGRASHRRPGSGQEQLGQHARHSTLRGLRCDLRHHLQLRGPEDQHPRPSDQLRRRADQGSVRGGRAGGRHLLVQLPRRVRPHQRRGVRQDRRRERGEIFLKAVASKGIKFVGHSDMDGRGDGVQVMVHRGYAYVGHGFSNGITTLDVRDPKNPKTVDFIACPPGTRAFHLQTP